MNITVKPTTSQSTLYTLTEFGFGNYNPANSSQYFVSILNDQESVYKSQTNQTYVTMDFRGIGLPSRSYSRFVNLLQIATNGTASCANIQGGMCALPQTCNNYQNLWQYSFRVAFDSNDGQYIVVPLSIFAQNRELQGLASCVIYVEKLDETLANSQSMVIGQMFFQSIDLAYFANFTAKQ